MGFWDTNRSHNPGQKTEPSANSQQKKKTKGKKTFYLENFASTKDNRVKKLKKAKKETSTWAFLEN